MNWASIYPPGEQVMTRLDTQSNDVVISMSACAIDKAHKLQPRRHIGLVTTDILTFCRQHKIFENMTFPIFSHDICCGIRNDITSREPISAGTETAISNVAEVENINKTVADLSESRIDDHKPDDDDWEMIRVDKLKDY